jgi:putative transposase
LNKILETIPEEEWNIAKKRFKIIEPFIYQQTLKEDIIKVAKENNIHYTTIYRWLKLYEKRGETMALVPNYNLRGGKGKKRLELGVELIIDKVINDLYLYKQKFTARQVYSEIKRRCINADLIPPHENTVRDRIKELDDKKVVMMRESRRSSDRKYQNTDGMFQEGTYPLDVIQIDHTPIDIIVVDEKYRQPIGRPYLTLAIDIYSRMVTGLYIALEEPSYFSVSQCLSNSILPKENFLRSLEIEGEWNICGIPRVLHLDNAQEFKSTDLRKVCENHNISIQYRPVARPQFGGHIERLIGTTMQVVHKLPGTTFSNIVKKGDYDSEKEAVLTLKELEMIICEFIVNEYHIRFHHGIETTPKKRYEKGVFGDDNTIGRGLPELVQDEEKFKLSLLPTLYRTIQQSGVKIDGIQYYHDTLRPYIKMQENGKPQKFLFKRDPRDISTIWFYEPKLEEYFPIPYKNITFPSISKWELQAIKRHLSDKELNTGDENLIFKTHTKIMQIQENAVKQTKLTRKANSAKVSHKRKQELDFPQTMEESNNATEMSYEKIFKNAQVFDDIDIGEDE